MLGNMLRVALSEVVLRCHRTGCASICIWLFCVAKGAHMRVLEQHTGMTAHQTLLLEMLKDIDIVCKRRRISYQLFAGTALGAVRHHGFIPWDDDVDIIMQWVWAFFQGSGQRFWRDFIFCPAGTQRSLANALLQIAAKQYDLHREVLSKGFEDAPRRVCRYLPVR